MYATSIGFARLYLNLTGFVGFSDYWNFEKHSNNDRGKIGEFETWIGSHIPGTPFMVLYGITPPVKSIPKN